MRAKELEGHDPAKEVKEAEWGPIGVAGVQFMQECSMACANCQYILCFGYHSNNFGAVCLRFEGR